MRLWRRGSECERRECERTEWCAPGVRQAKDVRTMWGPGRLHRPAACDVTPGGGL